jgi:hypothetical protein
VYRGGEGCGREKCRAAGLGQMEERLCEVSGSIGIDEEHQTWCPKESQVDTMSDAPVLREGGL